MTRPDYVNDARAYVNANMKRLPQRTHWASVAGVLAEVLRRKDAEIARLKREKKK